MVRKDNTADEETPQLNRFMASLTSGRNMIGGFDSHESKPGDVVIATYAKSGTTLLQNMVYQLVLTAGKGPSWDPDGTKFSDIGEVVPWIECSDALRVKECDSSPRVFKTHLSASKYDDLKRKGIRYIYCFRNGLDVPASYLDFLVEWANEGPPFTDDEQEKLFHDYVCKEYLGLSKQKDGSYVRSKGSMGAWFQHVKSWTEVPQENVLVLSYEHVASNLFDTAREIAVFLGFDVSDEELTRVAAKCDRAVMAADSRFQDNLFAKYWGKKSPGIKARLKTSGGYKRFSFSESARALYDEMFKDTFGVDSYAALVEKLTGKQLKRVV